MYGITGEYTDLCSAHNIITVLDGQALAGRKNKYRQNRLVKVFLYVI